MVSQIQLGNIFQENGKTVLGGSQSGFDTESLINDLVTVKQQPATDLTTANKTIDSEVTAFGTLSSLLGSFESAVDTLRNPPGVDNAAQNSFAFRTATVSATNGATASNYLSVTAQPGASIENFSIDQIKALAAQTKQHTEVMSLADTTTASAVTNSGDHENDLFSAGTITLKNVGGGADASITLAAGDSLQTVVNKFNAVTTQTGIQANILQVSSGQYELTFTGTQTGLANAFDLSAAPGPGQTVTGDTDGVLSKLTFSTTQSAADSDFFVDGIEVTRSSNAVTDVVPGLTLNLLQATPTDGLGNPTASLNVNIQPDTSVVTTAIQSFADAYNNLRLFISTQSQRNADGTPTTTAVLAEDPTLRSISNTVRSEVTQIVNGLTAGNPQSLADIGISFSDFAGDSTNPATSDIMNVDTDTLGAALSSNFNGVANVFEFNMTSDNPNLAVFSRTNALSATQFQITNSGGTFQATVDGGAPIDLTATALAGGAGYTLTAPTGSALDGLTLIYASNDDATINVNITQGIADQLYNAIDGMTNTTDGLVTNAVKSLSDEETRNNTQITTINDQVATYKDQITQQYANLESALTTANSLLALLTAQSNAQLANSGN